MSYEKMISFLDYVKNNFDVGPHEQLVFYFEDFNVDSIRVWKNFDEEEIWAYEKMAEKLGQPTLIMYRQKLNNYLKIDFENECFLIVYNITRGWSQIHDIKTLPNFDPAQLAKQLQDLEDLLTGKKKIDAASE